MASLSSLQDEMKRDIAWLQDIRGYLHANPELYFEEHMTSKRIQEELTRLGIPFTTNWGKPLLPDGTTRSVGTGVVAHIGTGKSPCVALRADMDALPITELTDEKYVPCKSKIPGKMHACGHDMHVTMLLGAARLLKLHEKEIKGTIRLVFQPAEEKGGGAKYMVDEGVLTMEPKVEAMFGLHMNPLGPTGELWSRKGAVMASSLQFDIFVKGHGGHAGMPFMTKDPICAGACIVQNINNFIARSTSCTEHDAAGVISITAFTTAESYNAVPNEANLKGTLRSLNNMQTLNLKKRLGDIVTSTAAMYGCTGTLVWDPVEYPVTFNNHELFDWAEQEFKQPAQPGGEVKIHNPTMGGEDFSFYTSHVPCVFMFLGGGSIPKELPKVFLHNGNMVLDEAAMPYGGAALSFLGMKKIAQLNNAPSTLIGSTQQQQLPSAVPLSAGVPLLPTTPAKQVSTYKITPPSSPRWFGGMSCCQNNNP